MCPRERASVRQASVDFALPKEMVARVLPPNRSDGKRLRIQPRSHGVNSCCTFILTVCPFCGFRGGNMSVVNFTKKNLRQEVVHFLYWPLFAEANPPIERQKVSRMECVTFDEADTLSTFTNAIHQKRGRNPLSRIKMMTKKWVGTHFHEFHATHQKMGRNPSFTNAIHQMRRTLILKTHFYECNSSKKG